MNEKSVAGIGLVFVLAVSSLAACSEGGTTPQNDQGGAGGGGGTSAGGSAGSVSGGGTSAGATAGGTTNGGSGGSVGGGTGGIPSGGSGGDGAGLGGVSPGGASPGGASPGGASPGGASSGGSGGDAGGGSTDVTVQLGQVRQTMAGFGINNNWAPAMTDAEADLMFNTTGNGLGLSILRIGMGSNGEPFNGANCWADINKAKARGVTTFIGTLWSPPASYKTNNSENDGGRLRPERYEDWANTIAAFPAKVKQNTQVDLYGMSPQNETDFASCGLVEPCNGNYPTTIFNASEYVAFLKVVGPKLKALNPPVRVIGPEASEWLHVWSNESATGSEPSNRNSSDPLRCGFPATMCAAGQGYDYGHALHADSTAWGLLDIMGVHQYDTQVAEPWPADVPSRKPVWQTEMSGVKWWPEQGPTAHIDNGVVVAGWIHNALTVGEASAWLWWWWKAISTDDNEGLYIQNGGTSNWTDTKRHYTLGNYSKFIRPGYVRVDITGNVPANILLTGFKGTDGTVVVVAINRGTASATVPIYIAGGTAPASMTPWVTSASDNLASKTAVMVSGGAFMATLASKTVTTFVGR
jgi:glucuronoarabinoxylan endo-1,4-beta-xylanase